MTNQKTYYSPKQIEARKQIKAKEWERLSYSGKIGNFRKKEKERKAKKEIK